MIVRTGRLAELSKGLLQEISADSDDGQPALPENPPSAIAAMADPQVLKAAGEALPLLVFVLARCIQNGTSMSLS